MNLASQHPTLITPFPEKSLSANHLSDLLVGSIQKNAEFKLFAKHFYLNVRCGFAEANYHTEIKRLTQRFNYLANITQGHDLLLFR